MSDNVIPLHSRPHIKCPACGQPMTRQQDRNFRCSMPACGIGYLKTNDGVRMRVQGTTVIFEADDGTKASS